MSNFVSPPSAFKIRVEAERRIAFTSPDHLMPWGTRRDNSRNRRFNQKLYTLYSNRHLHILDLGCSGGGFVKDCLDDGCLAIGLEGSDYSQKYRRAAWAIIPDFLFTCDVTGDFDICLEQGNIRERLLFDVVTSWELIEHIAERDLARVAANVKKHLALDGLWIMSVSPNKEVVNGVRLHQTVQPRLWWIKKFKQLGFEHLEAYVHYFNTQFIRGPKYGAPRSFHLVLNPDPSKAPPIPKQTLTERIYDRWLASRPQRLVQRLLIGD